MSITTEQTQRLQERIDQIKGEDLYLGSYPIDFKVHPLESETSVLINNKYYSLDFFQHAEELTRAGGSVSLFGVTVSKELIRDVLKRLGDSNG